MYYILYARAQDCVVQVWRLPEDPAARSLFYSILYSRVYLFYPILFYDIVYSIL